MNLKLERKKSDLDPRASLARSAGVIGSSTLLSRFLGMGRDIITAGYFGTSLAMSAFVVAFTIPNLLRKLLGEGALTAAFVPIFTEHLEKEGKEESWRIAGVIISLLSAVLAGLVLIGYLLIWIVLFCFSLSDPEDILIFRLLQVMLPYMFFICLVGLIAGILNSLRHFALPALAPVVLNLIWIAAIIFLCPLFSGPLENKIFGLAVGISLAGIVQLLLLLPALKKKGFRFRPGWNPGHPAVRRVLRLMGPAVLGLAVFQINVVIDKLLAIKFIGRQAPAVLYYGNRLVQLPLGVFGIAFATAVLPVMSSLAARGKVADFRDTFSHALRSVFVFSVPASIGLIVLGNPIVRLIFERNEFGPAATAATTRVLFYYCLGLFAFSGLKIVTQAFYAFQDTKTPVKVGAAAMLLNLGLNLLVVFNPWLKSHLREGGLALSTSIAAAFNILFLMILLRRKIGTLGGRKILTSLGRIVLASGLMGAGCWLALSLTRAGCPGAAFGDKLVTVLIPLLAGIAVFLSASRLFRVQETFDLIRAFRKNKTEKR